MNTWLLAKYEYVIVLSRYASAKMYETLLHFYKNVAFPTGKRPLWSPHREKTFVVAICLGKNIKNVLSPHTGKPKT